MVKSKKRKSRRKSKSRRRSYKCKYGMLKRSVRDKKTGKMRNCKKGPRKVKSRRKSVRKRKSRRKSVRKRKDRRKSKLKVRKSKGMVTTTKDRRITRRITRGQLNKLRKRGKTRNALILGKHGWQKNTYLNDGKRTLLFTEKSNIGRRPLNSKVNMNWIMGNPKLVAEVGPQNLTSLARFYKKRIERMTQTQTRSFALYNLKIKLKGNFDLTQDTKNKIDALKEVVKMFDGNIPENFKTEFTPLILKASNENYNILEENGLLSLIFPVYCANGYEESKEGKEKLIEFINSGDYIAALRFLGKVVKVDPSENEKTTDMSEIEGSNCFFFKTNTEVSDILDNVNFPYLEPFPYTCKGLNFGEDVRGQILDKIALLSESKEKIDTVISLIIEHETDEGGKEKNQFYLEKNFMY